MSDQMKAIPFSLDLSAFKKEGLYLSPENGTFLDFSKERIKQLAEEYWRKPAED